MSPADLIERVRTKILDPDSNDFSDSEIMLYLNEAGRILYNMIADRRPLMMRSVEVGTLDPDHTSISLSADPRRVLGVMSDGSPMDKLGRMGDLDLTKTGTPQKWYLSGFRVVSFFPVPGDGVSIDARVSYIPQYAEMTLEDAAIPFPDEGASMLAEFALLRCGIRNEGDMTQEATLFKGFRGEVLSWLSDLTPEGSDEGAVEPYWP